jgi:PadR family transcriptional regulator PadR
MAAPQPGRTSLLQGTLDMLILRTLDHGPAHGHDISRFISQATRNVLQVEHGSLYPALHRLEARGWIAAKWERHHERKREFKYYRLTPAGRRHLVAEHSRWRTLVEAIASVMQPIEES